MIVCCGCDGAGCRACRDRGYVPTGAVSADDQEAVASFLIALSRTERGDYVEAIVAEIPADRVPLVMLRVGMLVRVSIEWVTGHRVSLASFQVAGPNGEDNIEDAPPWARLAARVLSCSMNRDDETARLLIEVATPDVRRTALAMMADVGARALPT